MKHIKTGKFRREFEVLVATRSAQAAIITLAMGDTSNGEPSNGEPSNAHPKSEQWIFVTSGSGKALVGKTRRTLRRVKMAANSLLLIEKGELHQIKNTGTRPLRILNFYVPPAYNDDGDVRPSAKS
jgi:oxalate decarboxylase/phosphoglucose isomerase-like protein (cupin superfamily)